jgi:acetoin utilization deacetylase AcuC-like enzyme
VAFDDNTCVHSVLDCNTFHCEAVAFSFPPPMLASAARTCMLAALTIVEQTLHTRHRPPPGVRHVEVPHRLVSARDALRHANVCQNWRQAGEGAYSHTAALRALCAVHTSDHLEDVQRMSLRGGGFDTDTYCAPGSWEAMLDGTSAWLEATALAAAVEGPALALSRPAGHHATQNAAMGFGLVNFAAAAVKAHLAAHPLSRVAILDWDVHHGNGVAAIFREEPRVRYASTHEAGGFPQTGMREEERGPLGNVLNLPLPKVRSTSLPSISTVYLVIHTHAHIRPSMHPTTHRF